MHRDTEASALGGMRILVAEDDFLVATSLQEMLRSFGCSPVGPAFTLADGMALADAARLDGALVDLNLDGIWCLPLVQHLRTRGVPIAMVSSYDKGLTRLSQLKAVGWISKPFTPAQIREALLAWRSKSP